MTTRTLLLSLASLLVAALPAQAQTINSTSSTGTFPVANNDLIEGLTPTIVGGIEDRESLNSNTSGTALTNGTFGPAGLTNNPGPNPELVIIDNGVQLTYSLPDPLGYNITDINTYSGWRDTGRVNQNYDILYTTTTNPTFTSLTSVSENYAGGNPSSLAVFVSDVGLTDVTALRFDFPSTQNGYVGYKELDVIGSAAAAAVPEPSTAILAGLALLGLASFTWRRRTRV